jgi:histidinol-phosphate aminotransferase
MDEAYQPFASAAATSTGSHRHQPCAADAHAVQIRAWPAFDSGYMLGPKELIAEIDKVRPPYNVSVLNYECALFAH